jgi:predicted nucleotidyltransferase
MNTESEQEEEKDGTDETPSVTVEVTVPAKNTDIYRYKMTDELLRFLTHRPFGEYTQRELASIFETSPGSIRNAIGVLEDNDLVNVRRDGNRTLVQINRERVKSPDEPILRIPQSEFHEPVRRAVTKLRDSLEDVHGVLVYGSVARGSADRKSDIDLWVLVRENRSRNQRRATEIGQELSEQRIDGERYDFHVVVESPTSVPAHTEDIAEIVASGIPLYKTEEFEKFQSLVEDMIDA